MRVELLEGEGLERIRSDWTLLWQADTSAPPFLAPGWLLPWARHYAPRRCRAVSARSGTSLVALLPVFEWQGRLLLAGTGPSDYGGGLKEPSCEAAMDSLLRAVCEHSGEGIRQIDLQQVQSGSALLAASAPIGWADEREQGETCPVLYLEGVDGMDQVPRRWRKNWRYYSRRLEREGGVAELVSAAEATAALQDLERLHALRWSHRGDSGVFSDDLLRDFLRSAVPELAADGLLRMHRIRIGSASVAVLMALHGHGQTHYYISGFDPAYSALSPGLVLVGQAIACAAREGATEFHFLRGQEEYKYRWGAVDRQVWRRILTR